MTQTEIAMIVAIVALYAWTWAKLRQSIRRVYLNGNRLVEGPSDDYIWKDTDAPGFVGAGPTFNFPIKAHQTRPDILIVEHHGRVRVYSARPTPDGYQWVREK